MTEPTNLVVTKSPVFCAPVVGEGGVRGPCATRIFPLTDPKPKQSPHAVMCPSSADVRMPTNSLKIKKNMNRSRAIKKK